MYVSVTKSATNTQKISLLNGRNCLLLIVLCSIYGKRSKTRSDANNAKTPSSLSGMDLNMAYANKKYHSGCICAGVTKGLAGI